MKGLITDRTQRNVHYRKELSGKGFAKMTIEERAKWLGDPMAAEGANLFAYGPYYSSAVELKYRSETILATATAEGIYLYAIAILGEASLFANQVFTFSVDAITATGGGSPQIALYWHDDAGFEYAGADLSVAGSVTFDTSLMPNANNRQYLAAYVYVTTHATITSGATALFKGVMLERGSVRHPYVPYTEILATEATKGAYNYSDLNRVERAVAELSDMLGLGLVTKTDWGMWDIPTAWDMERYLGNVVILRQQIEAETTVPALPLSMNKLTYTDANNIELILSAVYEHLMES